MARKKKDDEPELPPAFQFYAKDWLSSPRVNAMSPAQEGAYIRLLALSWTNDDCALPDDDDDLARLSRLGDDWKNGLGEKIKKCFNVRVRKGRIGNEKLLDYRKMLEARREKSHDGGVKSGEVRRSKANKKRSTLHPSFEVNAKQTRTKSEANANSSSSSSSSTSIDSPNGESTDTTSGQISADAFLAAWNATPGTRQALNIKGGRLTHFKARARDPSWVADYQRALAKFPLKCFAAKPGGWQPNIDWFLRPDTVTTILENHYDWVRDDDPKSKRSGPNLNNGSAGSSDARDRSL